ncbi:MAG TPA: DUF1343 domain-containing protein [Turneriella sp.]|nr:DUF1343 domain-containing protein [Turneriella sp.]
MLTRGKYSILVWCIAVSAVIPVSAARKKTTAAARLSASAIFLKEGLKRLGGKDTCFITNASGLGRFFLYDAMEDTGKYMRDHLEAADVTLKHLFTPEHGLTAQEEDHGNTRTKAGAPETIYLTTVEKLQEKIKDCEAIVFDLPDSGVRPYTYRTVLNRIMRAMHANASDQLLYLIDVPNPASHLGPQGPVAQKSNFSYVGEEEIPFMPGFTQAELARKYIADRKLKIRIYIQKMARYNPKQPHSQRGLPFYPPSPNLPHLRSNQCYWISVYFEATSIEEGRITKDPFCQIGHPGFENKELPVMGGVKFQPYPFFAAGGKHKGKLLPGYKLQFSETAVNPTRAAYEFFLWQVKNGKDGFMKKWLAEKQGLDAQTGTTSYRASLIKGLSYEAWLAKEKKHIAEFTAAMQKYRLYK